jgi:hypothetical protein
VESTVTDIGAAWAAVPAFRMYRALTFTNLTLSHHRLSLTRVGNYFCRVEFGQLFPLLRESRSCAKAPKPENKGANTTTRMIC